MIQFKYIFFLIGWLLLILAGAILLPCGIDVYFGHQDAHIYFTCFLIMVFFGLSLVFINRTSHDIELTKKDTFLLTFIAWIFALGFCALPFALASPHLNFTDSLFEATSGLTTTGATILTNLDQMAPGILVWRATLQWLGGIGIVVMALTVMPTLRIGGMELFQTESSEKSEKFLPRVKQIAKIIFMTYVILTVVCFGCLLWAGMDGLDALCHTFSTVSTGGFSTHDSAISFFDSTAIKIILIIFMITGGVPQLLLAKAIQGKVASLFQDQQTRGYFILMILSSFLLIGWRVLNQHEDIQSISLDSIFHVVSVLTTTGFEEANYMWWGPFALVLFFVLTFIGGCTGSTSGGIKVFRIQVLEKMGVAQLKRSHSPYGVFVPKYNNKVIADGVFQSTAGFFIIFMASFTILILILSMLGLDLLNAICAAAASLSNTGIALGDIGDTAHSFVFLSDPIKWTLMAGMILGRLEFITVMVLFLPHFWRD